MSQRRTVRTRRVQRARRQHRLVTRTFRELGMSAERACAALADGFAQAMAVLGEALLGFFQAFVDGIAAVFGDTFLEAWNCLTPEEQDAVMAEARAAYPGASWEMP